MPLNPTINLSEVGVRCYRNILLCNFFGLDGLISTKPMKLQFVQAHAVYFRPAVHQLNGWIKTTS
eukprot:12650409-Ditylum_brightwellii.AAC.1